MKRFDTRHIYDFVKKNIKELCQDKHHFGHFDEIPEDKKFHELIRMIDDVKIFEEAGCVSCDVAENMISEEAIDIVATHGLLKGSLPPNKRKR